MEVEFSNDTNELWRALILAGVGTIRGESTKQGSRIFSRDINARHLPGGGAYSFVYSTPDLSYDSKEAAA